ncbi:MAG: hypothetical protein CME60_12840 [Halobacteriovoraceae bacterium]|nr:hypothetical protein [Halobacteriovoraceae bacterium]
MNNELSCHGGQVVKDFYTKKFCHTFFLTSLLTFSSCSWIDTDRSSLFGDDPMASAQDDQQQMVPKEQFDELAKKYEALLKQKRIEQSETAKANKLMNQIESEQVIDADIVAQEISRVKTASELGGTVDVFDQSSAREAAPVGKPIVNSVQLPSSASYDANLVEAEIAQIRKAEALVGQNKFDQALTMIKSLEKSSLKQIVVRAKFLLGEILFKQGEYDLSMQIFEEVIGQYAFSGLVIKTLGRLIVCSEKLKLAAKQEKYYSILHDFFEQGA